MDPGASLVSVVMPCYNASRFLPEALASVLAQSHRKLELIAVDDGSSDDTLVILERTRAADARLKVLRQANQGPYPARNLGLREARGGFVAFLDADDYWDPDFLARMLAAFAAGEPDLVYCGWQNVGATERGTAPYLPPAYEEGDAVRYFLRGCPWPIHAALVRRAALQAVDGFSVRCFSSMDYDLWLRLYAHSRRLKRVDAVLAYYRWHASGQISANRARQALDAWRVRTDFLRANPQLVRHIPPAERRALVDGALKRAAYDAYWRRDLEAAHKLLRRVLWLRCWAWPEARYLLPALLPLPWYKAVIRRLSGNQRQPAAP